MIALVLTLAFVLLATTTQAAENPQANEEFFEAKVRPLLLEKCVECHGPDDASGELRLDRRSAVIKGGASGALVDQGNPAASRLLKAIDYKDSALQMPPDGKLTDEEIGILTQWVETGAFWPEESADADAAPLPPSERIDEFRENHWSFQPLAAVAIPEVAATGWPRSPIDHFVLQKLEQSGLSPNHPADRRTLILRAYFTLIGLPPSYDEVNAFVSDDSPDAFERLIDRLLDNEHYGERWARHWLDIARYADTTGYFPGSRDTSYPYAYTYRDYVINAFNSDKPYNQFVIEQIAADRLELPEDDRQALAAMGFLSVGRRFMNRQHDIIDDRIDVVTRGFLGLSVACSRCHDHKYDPIPTADYYSLYGVFASTHEPEELPLLGDPTKTPRYQEFLDAKAEKQREVDQWLEERRVAIERELRSRIADYLVYLAKTLPGQDAGDVPKVGERGALRVPAIQRWQAFLSKQETKTDSIWSVWHTLTEFKSDTFASQLEQAIGSSENPIELPNSNGAILQRLRQSKPQSIADAAKVVGTFLEEVYANWNQTVEKDPAVNTLSDPNMESARQFLISASAPTSLDIDQANGHLDQAERNTYNSKLGQIKAVEAKHPGAPARGMVLLDNANPHDPVIFKRGQPGNRGDRVPRRFLQILSHVDGGQPFTEGSGRLELAKAIASSDNPLTARVIVNRIWQHHFGAGLVRTASDFGTRGEPPTHPELLDYLAKEFIDDGWSIKRLQKRIMLTATWQQSSVTRADAEKIDPENRLLGRMPRQRLEFEPLRDRLLFTAGTLQLDIGGRSVMIHKDARRRGLYAYIDREDVPGLLASFDVPSPDASQAIRAQTTVPQQALFLLNSEFVIQQATALYERVAAIQNTDERVNSLYRLALARDADAEEIEFAKRFLGRELLSADDSSPTEDEGPVWDFGYGYFDSETNRVAFEAMPHFTGEHWQGGSEFPDSKYGHLRLSAGSGHPGNNAMLATIIRWVSPGDGSVKVTGMLRHRADKGDGVRGTLVSSRKGVLATWDAFHSEASTTVASIEVQRGETLDFILDCRETPSFDSYQWAPQVTVVQSGSLGKGEGSTWSSQDDFLSASRERTQSHGLDPWIQLAQALLVCNEFAFVD